MKRIAVLVLVLSVLLCVAGCFKSADDVETSEATSAVLTTAPTVSTVAMITTTTVAVGSLDNFPCVGYTTDSLNVRRDASTDYDAIGGLEKGASVKIVGREGDFYKIEWSSFDGNFDGEYAYVSAQYISATPGGATTAAVSTTGALVSDPTMATTAATTAATTVKTAN